MNRQDLQDIKKKINKALVDGKNKINLEKKTYLDKDGKEILSVKINGVPVCESRVTSTTNLN